jgi:hypothetical protein
VLLRAPTQRMPDDRVVPLRVRAWSVEVSNGHAANRVRISTGWHRQTIDLAPGEVKIVEIRPGGGVPYKPARYPTNYVYAMSVTTSAGFVPFLEDPGNTDSRYLGAMVRVVPIYYNP